MGDKIPPPDIEEPPPFTDSNMAMLYYGLVIVGTAALLFAIYNIIIIRWCSNRRGEISGRRLPPFVEATAGARSQSYEPSNNNLLPSFKFKKEKILEIENGDEFECAVCLSEFEEGEEVRQLPGCKHAFHACCIDMWLHSHSDCPLCRARVQPPFYSLCPRIPAVAAANTASDNVLREQFARETANARFTPGL